MEGVEIERRKGRGGGEGNKNIHFEMILDVGIGEKRKETRLLI